MAFSPQTRTQKLMRTGFRAKKSGLCGTWQSLTPTSVWLLRLLEEVPNPRPIPSTVCQPQKGWTSVSLPSETTAWKSLQGWTKFRTSVRCLQVTGGFFFQHNKSPSTLVHSSKSHLVGCDHSTGIDPWHRYTQKAWRHVEQHTARGKEVNGALQRV